jgi:hypothetical protein
MRKGVMFSFIMFFLATTLMGLIFLQRSMISYGREKLFIEMRVNALNRMYDSIIRDLGKTLEIITQRAMTVCFNNVSVSGIPLTEANETLEELILNGTLNGTEQALMENATFPYWVEKIERAAILKGFDVNITHETLMIKPYDSFNLLVEVEVMINIIDEHGVAALNRSSLVEKLVPIEGLEDPLYPLKTSGLMSNVIIESPFQGNYTQVLLIGNGENGYVYGETTHDVSDFTGKILVVYNASEVSGLSNAKGVISETDIIVPITIPYIVNSSALNLIPAGINVLLDGSGEKVWYIENLREHVGNSYYQPSTNGPSYLDRLEGKLEVQAKYASQSNNVIGLESFIDKAEIPAELTVDLEKTNIDYLYFSDTFVGGDGVKGLSASFRIDDLPSLGSTHQEIYNVTELVIE